MSDAKKLASDCGKEQAMPKPMMDDTPTDDIRYLLHEVHDQEARMEMRQACDNLDTWCAGIEAQKHTLREQRDALIEYTKARMFLDEIDPVEDRACRAAAVKNLDAAKNRCIAAGIDESVFPEGKGAGDDRQTD